MSHLVRPTTSAGLRLMLRSVPRLNIPHRTLTRLRDDDLNLEFLEGDKKGL